MFPVRCTSKAQMRRADLTQLINSSAYCGVVRAQPSVSETFSPKFVQIDEYFIPDDNWTVKSDGDPTVSGMLLNRKVLSLTVVLNRASYVEVVIALVAKVINNSLPIGGPIGGPSTLVRRRLKV
ncbi:hypothetical protein EVAR_80626_1 [Eumeta japonica]|uniref:Uncharacterized protein n=1 Tax=Eumeta variegata TaxID=151549 RepID=A0A4C1YQT2_EUMVA|nr:hypothetical protein EVAR_80626_1 [Eumeta japonica]